MQNNYIKVVDDALIYISPPEMLGHFTKKNIKFEKNHLNKSACKMLHMAKKQIPVNRIINEYLMEIGKKNEKNFEALFDFFKKLEEWKIIKLVPEPFNNEGRIIGHFDKYYPKILTYELTDRCNLYCSHCYNASHSKKSLFMDWQKLLPLFKKLKTNGLEIVQFTGGEPMLHPDFKEILEFSCNIFDSVYILTNGTLITDTFIDQFKTYKDKIKFSISLDNHVQEKHEKIRNYVGCFAMTTEGVKKLRIADFHVRIGMTFNDETIDDIYRTFEFSIEELNANHFTFTPVLPYGRSNNCWHAADAGTFHKVSDVMNKIEESPYKEKIAKMPSLTDNPKNCGAGYKNFTVCADGVLKPCVLFPKNFCKIGNIFEDDTDTLFSRDNLGFFIDIDVHRGKPECANCDFNYKFCEGCLLNSLVLAHNKKNCQWGKKNASKIKEVCDPKYSYDFKFPEVK